MSVVLAPTMLDSHDADGLEPSHLDALGAAPRGSATAPLERSSWADAIVDQSDDAILSKRLDGTIISWNASAERIFGYSACEMIGQPITRFIPPDRLHEEAECLGRLVTGKAISPVETLRIRKDGSIVTISATLSPLRDASGVVVAVSMIARDIGAWKLRREQLDQVTTDLATIVDHCPGLISYWNADYTNRFANKAYAETFGFRTDDIQGRHAKDVLGPQLFEKSRPYIEAARSGTPQSYERLTRLPNGEVRYHQLDYMPDQASGDSGGLIVFVNDVTPRKVAEHALAESAARFKQLYEDTPAIMHSIDARGHLLSVSGHWLRKLGYAREEVLGRPFADFLTSASRERLHIEHLGAFRVGHDSVRLDYQMVCKDGRLIDVVLSAIAERDAKGEFTKGMAVIEDVTAQKAAEEALRASEAFLERAGAVAGVGGFRVNLATGEHFWTRHTFIIHGLEGPIAPTLHELDAMFDPGTRARLQRALAATLQGRGYDMEARLIAANGRSAWIRVVGEVEFANGNPAFVCGAVQDITERKAAEQALRASQEFLDRAGSIAGVGAWSYDLRTGAIYWSTETCRIHGRELGYKPSLEEVLAHFPGQSRLVLEGAVEACVTRGIPYDLELAFITVDGRHKFVRAVGEAELEDGRAIRLFGALQDITARKQSEAHLLDQHELLRVTLDSIGDAVITTDARGAVQWLNPVAALLTGWSSTEAPGLPIAQVFNIADKKTRRPINDPATRALWENGLLRSNEDSILIARNGRELGIELSAAPIRSKLGDAVGTVLVFHDVSERQRAAAALRCANERLAMATDAACIGIWEFHVAENSVHCDAEMCRIYGLPAGSLSTFEQWAVTLHPADSEATQRAVIDALGGVRDYDGEFRVVRPDGEIRYVKAAGRVQRDSTGSALLMVGINLDITERKRAEAAVDETSSHARALYKVTSAIINQHQIAALLQTVVDTVAEALPADRVTLIAFDTHERSVTHFVKGGARADFVVQVPFDELVQGLSGWVLRTGKPALSPKDTPDPREGPDVQKRRAETHCGDILVVPIGYQGHIIGTLTAINDPAGGAFEEKHVELVTAMAGHVAVAITNIGLIGELTDNARELHVTTQRLTLATDAAGMGIWEWDPVANTFRWDDQMYPIYDRVRSGELEPYSLWTNTLHREDRERAEQELQAAFVDDRALDTEYRIVQPNGTVRHVKASTRVQHDANGRPLRLVGVTFDTTERNEAVARAQAANLAKSQFLANMSHEIRTPLNAIIGLGYLLEQTLLSEEQRSFLAKIQFAGRSLLSVVNNVLDLSKIEAGEMILEDTAFDVVGLAQQVGQMLAPQAQAKGVDLLVRPSTNLPRLLRGDATRLRQILTNLLNNAIKFTGQGHVALELSCLEQSGGRICLRCTVRDTGIGIGPEGIARLFTPFAQADTSTTRRFGGTGLGLSIARGFVELMGGQIGVKSDLGVGSEFWVELPLRIANDSDVDLTGTALRPLHLLIIEPSDAPIALDSMIRPLGWLSHTVTHADSAVARLRAGAGREWPDVIIIDAALRIFSPLQIVSRLRGEFAHVELPPMIVIDDDNQSCRQHEQLQQMVSVVLPRPVSGSALFNAVNSAMTMRAGDHQSALQATNFDQVIAQWLPGARILVVDDSDVNRVVAQSILEKQGASVVLCSNGAEAVERLRRTPQAFDVILMDVQMPELDGNQATRYIRNELNLKALPIIALTAGALVSERERSLQVGMSEFLSKPLEPATLIRVVRRFVEQQRGAPLPVGIVDKDRNPAGVAAGLASIDAKVAQQMIGNDTDLFASLLGRLLREFGEFALPITLELPDGATRKIWTAKLHKLRGSAGVIGAKAVQRLAGAGERALEEGQPDDFVEALLRQLAAAFTALREEVQPLIDRVTATRAANADCAASVAPASEFAVTELIDLLDNRNLDAMDQFNAIAQSLSLTLGDVRFAHLREAVEGLEFCQAAALLRAGMEFGSSKTGGG